MDKATVLVWLILISIKVVVAIMPVAIVKTIVKLLLCRHCRAKKALSLIAMKLRLTPFSSKSSESELFALSGTVLRC